MHDLYFTYSNPHLKNRKTTEPSLTGFILQKSCPEKTNPGMGNTKEIPAFIGI
jgi:hypothetical protein